MRLFETRKARLLDTLLTWIAVLGAVAYFPSLYASLVTELYLLAAIDTVGYLLVLIVAFSRRTGYLVRLRTMVGVSLLLGAAVLLTTGNDGAGHLWLLCAVFIAALFGSRRIAVLAIVATQLIMAAYALLLALDLLPFSASLISIVAISANMLLISIALSFVTIGLLDSLKGEIDRQEEVLQLLHHRVRNTLQTVESLISDGGDSEAARRRIRAVLSVNELLVEDHLAGHLELGELFRVISRPPSVSIVVEQPRLIPAETCIGLAVGFSDLIEALKEFGPLTIRTGREITIRAAQPIPSEESLNTVAAGPFLPPMVWGESEEGGTVISLVIR